MKRGKRFCLLSKRLLVGSYITAVLFVGLSAAQQPAQKEACKPKVRAISVGNDLEGYGYWRVTWDICNP